jgi:hypothetical protein
VTVGHIKEVLLDQEKLQTLLAILAKHPGVYFASDIFLDTKFATQDMIDMTTKLKHRLVASHWNQNHRNIFAAYIYL